MGLRGARRASATPRERRKLAGLTVKSLRMRGMDASDPSRPTGDINDVIAHNGHQFSVATLASPHWCAHCNNFIWGLDKQCYRCKCTTQRGRRG